jgi:hypothetical protein
MELVTLLDLRIWRWLLDFWKFCTPLHNTNSCTTACAVLPAFIV